ncbi:MAG: acyl-ACP thioesterase [Bacteroidales bacterium]|nr:acyl-ACP thioesterase [Bacteroidales bacterium]
MIETELRRQMNVDIHQTNYNGEITPRLLCDIFSDIAQCHTINLGIDVATLKKQGLTWMLHRMHIIINRMPHLGERVEILTHPAGVNRLFALRCYRVAVADTREELIKANSDWMIIDIERRRPVRPIERLIEINKTLSMPDDMPHNYIENKHLPADMVETRRFCATFDNIDFNGHVTQASYIQMITNSLDFGFLTANNLCEAEIVYEHEIMPDSTVVAFLKTEDVDGQTVIWHKLMSPDGAVEHCFARTVWRKKG